MVYIKKCKLVKTRKNSMIYPWMGHKQRKTVKRQKRHNWGIVNIVQNLIGNGGKATSHLYIKHLSTNGSNRQSSCYLIPYANTSTKKPDLPKDFPFSEIYQQ